MEKNDSEIAGEVTAAWINALGATLSAGISINEGWSILSDQDKIAEFYRTIYKQVRDKTSK